MKKYIQLLLTTLLTVFFATGQMAAGNVEDYKMQVPDFSVLKVNDNINVEYRCSADSAGYVFFECPSEQASMLLFTSHKSALTVQLDDAFTGDVVPTVRVYSSVLDKVENSGDSTVRIVSAAPVTSFKATVIGNGTVIIDSIEATNVVLSINTGKGHIAVERGTTFKLSLNKMGKGTIEAGGLKASEVKVKMLGPGDIDCNVSETLSIFGGGSGTVYYSGNPRKVSNHSMGVKAVALNME